VSVGRVERQANLRYSEGVLGYGQTFTPADMAKFGKAPYVKLQCREKGHDHKRMIDRGKEPLPVAAADDAPAIDPIGGEPVGPAVPEAGGPGVVASSPPPPLAPTDVGRIGVVVTDGDPIGGSPITSRPVAPAVEAPDPSGTEHETPFARKRSNDAFLLP